MSSFVLDFQEIENTYLSLVGGKGLNLGELSNIQGIQVPEGFCVTTIGYEKAIEQNEGLQILLQQLTMLKIEERGQICEISKKIREVIMAVEIPFFRSRFSGNRKHVPFTCRWKRFEFRGVIQHSRDTSARRILCYNDRV